MNKFELNIYLDVTIPQEMHSAMSLLLDQLAKKKISINRSIDTNIIDNYYCRSFKLVSYIENFATYEQLHKEMENIKKDHFEQPHPTRNIDWFIREIKPKQFKKKDRVMEK